MALTDTAIQKLRSKAKPYQIADGGGLFLEVMPGGKKVWRMRYWLRGKQEKVTLGSYRAISLNEARRTREDYKIAIEHGESPMLAKARDKVARLVPDSVKDFAGIWVSDVVEKQVKNPKDTKRTLQNDILPAIGSKRLDQITTSDVLAITDRIKARGSDQMALKARNIVKRLFDYAIARQKLTLNPANAIQAAFIAKASKRTTALTGKEIGSLLRAIYASNMRRANKLALHLLMITMVRKTELTSARWNEIDLDTGEWTIPGERMKKELAHMVYLPTHALKVFNELKTLSCGSEFVFPSRSSLKRHISAGTLNHAVAGLTLDIQAFVIHDFRRTASTHANEAGFNSDAIEKALAHEQRGVRGVYNKAAYAKQRKELLQWWGAYVESQIDEPGKVIAGRFGRAA